MKFFFVLIFLLAGCGLSYGQAEKNYVVEIDGDTISASLGHPVNFKTKDGKTIRVQISKKEFLDFKKGPVSFSYPSKFSVTSAKVDEDVEQIILLSAVGTGIIIQLYKTMNPENGMMEVLLSEITSDDIKAGYSETRTDIQKTINGGVLLSGKKSILTMDEDVSKFSVFVYGKGKKGVSVIEMDMGENGEDEVKLLEIFWKTFKIVY